MKVVAQARVAALHRGAWSRARALCEYRSRKKRLRIWHARGASRRRELGSWELGWNPEEVVRIDDEVYLAGCCVVVKFCSDK